jgi:hypothetical protein
MNRVLMGFGTVLGIAALFALGVYFHTRAVSKYGDERFEAGKAEAYAAVASHAQKVGEQAAALAAKIREHTDADIRNITADANALRLHGPGKAVCTGSGTPAPATSGHIAPGGTADTPVADMYSEQRPALVGLPFADALSFAEQCDANRAEVIAWRTQRTGVK